MTTPDNQVVPDAPGSRAPMSAEQMTLDELPEGSLFETLDGVLAVKSEYKYSNGRDSQWQCVLLASGEYAHFEEKNRTVVRPIDFAALRQRAEAAERDLASLEAEVKRQDAEMAVQTRAHAAEWLRQLTAAEAERDALRKALAVAVEWGRQQGVNDRPGVQPDWYEAAVVVLKYTGTPGATEG